MIKHFYNNAKILYGKGALDRICHEINLYRGKRILLIVDGKKVSGQLLNNIKQILLRSNLSIVEVTVIAEEYASVENVTLAYSQYMGSSSDIILCVGGDFVAGIGKAVKAMVNTGKSALSDIQDINVPDRTPLFLIPTYVSTVSYGAGKANIYDIANNAIYKLSGVSLQPNRIIVDISAVSKIAQNAIHEKILLVLGMALLSVTDERIPVGARMYAMTALDLLQGMMENEKIDISNSADKIVLAHIFASIAYDNISSELLDSTIFNLMIRSQVALKDLFISVFPKYLSLFGALYDYSTMEMMGQLLDIDAYINIDLDKKAEYIISRIKHIVDIQKAEVKDYRLTSLGVKPDIIEDVIGTVSMDMNITGNHEMINKIRSMLYDVL